MSNSGLCSNWFYTNELREMINMGNSEFQKQMDEHHLGVEDNMKNRLEITTTVVVELPGGSVERTRGCDYVVFRDDNRDSLFSISHRELVVIVEELGKE